MTRRITDHRDVLFPVRTVHVFAQMRAGDEASLARIPGRKAIVNCTTGRVISVVSDNYQVVTNHQALDYAYQCCEAAFPGLPARSWIVNAADGPLTGGHCHIDLSHTSAQIRFGWEAPGRRPDIYGPFVRVTNSYNRTRALGFDIGFMRKVCSNGMILPQSSIRFSFDHNTRNIADRIRFQTSGSQFQNLKTKFLAFLEPLRNCEVPKEQFLPITLLAMRVRHPESLRERQKQAWEDLRTRVESLVERYVSDLGPNGYALMNVISDLASRPVDALNRRERHSLQRLAGSWLAEFSAECSKAGFCLTGYVERLGQGAWQSAAISAGEPPAPQRVILGQAGRQAGQRSLRVQ